jgi:hypothetical protein
MVRMSQGQEVKRIVVSESRLQEIVQMLGLRAANVSATATPDSKYDKQDISMEEMRPNGHLTDELFVDLSLNRLPAATRKGVDSHLAGCLTCSEEAARLTRVSTLWNSEAAIGRLEQRVRTALDMQPVRAGRGIGGAIAAFVHPYVISLTPLIRPQGAYGETKDEETSTLEFPVTQDGKIVEGLRGLLKRVNRDYYVRIFAIDPGARTEYGDRKAVIDISDSRQERPILRRRIDIGVTVLLGTDFRLTDSSSLAVEMLPIYQNKVNA